MSSDSPANRALVAFAVVFAPGQASSLLSRLEPPCGEALREQAARAPDAPRRERLAALAAFLAGAASNASVEQLAARERPHVAAAVRGCAANLPTAGASVAFRRLVREWLMRAPG